MTSQTIEQRQRRFLLLVSAAICVGTVLELLLTEHMGSAIQYVPFVLCGLGLTIVLLVLFRSKRRTLLALRIVMIIVALGSGFGMVEHLEHNVAFEMEIRPNATISEVWLDALQGANPLLAPGILALAAVLAIGATYYHPLLEKK